MKATKAQLESLRSQIIAVLRAAHEPLLVRDIALQAGLDVSVVGFQLKALWNHGHIRMELDCDTEPKKRMRRYWIRDEDRDDLDKINRMIGIESTTQKGKHANDKEPVERTRFRRLW